MEDLPPFRMAVQLDLQARQVERLAGRDRGLRQVDDVVIGVLGHEHLLAVGGDFVAAHDAEAGFLAGGQVEQIERRQAAAARPADVEKRAADRGERAVVGGRHGQLQDAIGDAVHVHLDGDFLFLVLFLFVFFHVLGEAGFVALGLQRRRRILAQSNEVDALHVEEDVVPLGRAIRRGEVAIGDEEEVLAVAREGGMLRIEPAVRDGK